MRAACAGHTLLVCNSLGTQTAPPGLLRNPTAKLLASDASRATILGQREVLRIS